MARLFASAVVLVALFAWPALVSPVPDGQGISQGVVLVSHRAGGHGLPGTALGRFHHHAIHYVPAPTLALASINWAGLETDRPDTAPAVGTGAPPSLTVLLPRVRAPPSAG